MRAEITKSDGYFCAPEGHTVIYFHFGQIVEGKVATCAIADGAAKELSGFKPLETADDAPVVEVKAKRTRAK